MYKSIKHYFRLKKLALQLKKNETKIDFLNDLKQDSYVLIIDAKIPEFDKDSGSRRLTEIIKIILQNNIGVFLMVDFKEYKYKSEYITIFKKMGVIVYEPTLDRFGKLITKEKFLKTVLPKVSYTWLHRPEIFEKYQTVIKKYKPESKIFFDMVDFHYLRFKREYELKGDSKIMKIADKYLKLELDNCKKADKIIVISNSEKESLKTYYKDDNKTIVIGNIHQYIKNDSPVNFDNRKDLLFIGGFNHKPNVDAVIYLYEEIMPLLWKIIPEISITIIGSSTPSSISVLHSDKFKILGYIEDVSPYFLNSRIFVAPLRYGAGIKGKIGQSLEYGLPLVTTDVGAEGFDFCKNKNIIIGNTSQEIVDNIIKIYQNEELWTEISLDSQKVIEPFSIDTINQKILSLIS